MLLAFRLLYCFANDISTCRRLRYVQLSALWFPRIPVLLESALKNFSMGQMNSGNLLTANPAGQSMIDKLEDVLEDESMKEDNKTLKERIAVMNNKISSLKEARSRDRYSYRTLSKLNALLCHHSILTIPPWTPRSKSLQPGYWNRIDDLTQACSDLRAIRNRFLDQYRDPV